MFEPGSPDVIHQVPAVSERQVKQHLATKSHISALDGRARGVEADEPPTRVRVLSLVRLDDLRYGIDSQVFKVPGHRAHPVEIAASHIDQSPTTHVPQK